MNQIYFHHPKIENDKKISYLVPADATHEKVITDQISEIFISQQYEKGKVKKDMVVMDVGANIGLASLYFKDWAKTIYALEPNPRNYECLVENTKAYPHIKTFNVGLAAKTATEELRSGEPYPIAESLFGEGPVKTSVNLVSIEQFMNEQKIEHVDLLKMDTEGAEYIIFPSEGFSKMAPKIDYIIGEAHYCAKLVPDYIPAILKDCGFETEFLPYDNMFLVLTFEEGTKKTYRVDKQTIFFAKRKGLK